jgi:uncharacterized protein YhbP (UPF0306 family)
MERRIASSELKVALEELLRLTTMTIATAGRDGVPHAAAVYFACDDLINLFFFSDVGSQHALDSSREPRAAVTIQVEGSGWQEIHGLQMRGIIKEVQSDNEWQRAWVFYRTKFPFVIDLEQLVTINQLYAFHPLWIRLVDNRQGFGFKQEWVKIAAEHVGVDTPSWRLETNELGSLGNMNG